MTTITEVQEHQRAFLQRAKERTEPIVMVIEGVECVVNPGVFPPATDTKLLAAHAHLNPEARFADVTTGSGMIPLIAGLSGATGYAVDINPLAVENAKHNIEKAGLDITIIESDLFSNVPPNDFDVIFANGPFFEGTIVDPMDYACYGVTRFHTRLFEAARTRLKPNGVLRIVVSEWVDEKFLTDIAKKNMLTIKNADTRKSDDGQRTYYLYELRKEK